VKYPGTVAFTLALCLGAAAVRAQAPAVTLTDDAGHSLRLAAPPQRIISLLPSLTETVCALDACERLVATDDYSNWPAAAAHLPKVGGLGSWSVELIVRQRPQLVLLGAAGGLRDRLDALGIATFVIEPVTYDDVARTITEVAALLGEPARGAALRDSVAHAVDAVAAAYRARGHAQPSVYFEIDSTPYAAGPQSFIGELITRLGARNIVAAGLGAFPRLNPEYVVMGNPDVILLSGTPLTALAGRPGWSGITAVREGRICDLAPAVADPLMRPGPRVGEGIRAIADCLARFRR
jgi:iron complex transport system substrate-binding protein